jgi:hypothetical protein
LSRIRFPGALRLHFAEVLTTGIPAQESTEVNEENEDLVISFVSFC